MNPNDLNQQIRQSPNSLIYGTCGSGKTTFAIDVAVKYLQENFKNELFNKEINLLHPLVRGQIPVLFLTNDFPFYILSKIKDRIFQNNSNYDFNPLVHTFNFCRVSNYSILTNLEDFLISRQSKLIIMEGFVNSPYKIEELRKIMDIVQKHQVTLINTVSSRTNVLSNDQKIILAPFELLRYSHLAIETTKCNIQSINLKVTKNRFGPVNTEIKYEL